MHDAGIDARFVQLDVTDQTTIDAAAAHIERAFGKLDILVNNAAIVIDNGPPSQLDIEVLRRTYDTNFFGAFAVLKAMLPLGCQGCRAPGNATDGWAGGRVLRRKRCLAVVKRRSERGMPYTLTILAARARDVRPRTTAPLVQVVNGRESPGLYDCLTRWS